MSSELSFQSCKIFNAFRILLKVSSYVYVTWVCMYVNRRHSSVFSCHDLDKIPVPAISVLVTLRAQIASPEKNHRTFLEFS